MLSNRKVGPTRFLRPLQINLVEPQGQTNSVTTLSTSLLGRTLRSDQLVTTLSTNLLGRTLRFDQLGYYIIYKSNWLNPKVGPTWYWECLLNFNVDHANESSQLTH